MKLQAATRLYEIGRAGGRELALPSKGAGAPALEVKTRGTWRGSEKYSGCPGGGPIVLFGERGERKSSQ